MTTFQFIILLVFLYIMLDDIGDGLINIHEELKSIRKQKPK